MIEFPLAAFGAASHYAAKRELNLRTVLCVPGHREDFLVKARTAGAGVLMLDLEDGVPEAERSRAIAVVNEHLTNQDLLRVPLDAWSCPAILALAQRAAAVVVPKLTCAPHAYDWASRVSRWILLLEDPTCLLRAQEFLAMGKRERPAAIFFGAADFRSRLGILFPGSSAVEYAREQVAILAAALGVPAVDAPCEWTGDVQEEAEEAVRLGFAGKGVLSPREIPIVNEAFATRDRAAQELLETWDGSIFRGEDGLLISPPMIRAARRILGSDT